MKIIYEVSEDECEDCGHFEVGSLTVLSGMGETLFKGTFDGHLGNGSIPVPDSTSIEVLEKALNSMFNTKVEVEKIYLDFSR